ncbi:putative THAP domain-containing protein 10-like isoform X3 [Apostichopus japonicus]|uniref:Putative THAP domain-containing protein 10-like isoform X3 n=1 Tax=Stichopus japonicus TaxID=307972 RepID=A0A2G8KHR7_STIJA|nr:putative THAP domain-containing protein 10-like isoform X3 [Apostichopus japonicus]
MPRRCIVDGCNNVSGKGISTYKLPTDKKIKELLVSFVNNTRSNFKRPTQHTVICSDHFDENCFSIATNLRQQFGFRASQARDSAAVFREEEIEAEYDIAAMQRRAESCVKSTGKSSQALDETPFEFEKKRKQSTQLLQLLRRFKDTSHPPCIKRHIHPHLCMEGYLNSILSRRLGRILGRRVKLRSTIHLMSLVILVRVRQQVLPKKVRFGRSKIFWYSGPAYLPSLQSVSNAKVPEGHAAYQCSEHL